MIKYIYEYLEPPERQFLVTDFTGIRNKVFDYFDNGLTIDEIVERLHEDLYIFTDEEETEWEKKVVTNILEGKPITNRFTDITFDYKQKR